MKIRPQQNWILATGIHLNQVFISDIQIKNSSTIDMWTWMNVFSQGLNHFAVRALIRLTATLASFATDGRIFSCYWSFRHSSAQSPSEDDDLDAVDDEGMYRKAENKIKLLEIVPQEVQDERDEETKQHLARLAAETR